MIKDIKNFIKTNTGFLIRLDDIAENMQWDYMDQLEKLFDKFNIKPVLGVIPNNNDPELLSYPIKDADFWNKVRMWKDKGWGIGMHGNDHVYKTFCKKVDYLGHGGNTEFCGLPIDNQLAKIKEGLKKFAEEKISVRTFFAPNHTFDENTLSALKESGVYDVLDGYGIMPYEENQIRYIPQLFYKIIKLPFGIQTIQIHLNYLKKKDLNEFEDFVEDNANKIINYDQAILKINNNLFYKFIRLLTKKILQAKRLKIRRS